MRPIDPRLVLIAMILSMFIVGHFSADDEQIQRELQAEYEAQHLALRSNAEWRETMREAVGSYSPYHVSGK